MAARRIVHSVDRVTPVIVVRLRGAEPPGYQSRHAAGCDLRARIERSITLRPGSITTIPTGIHLEVPVGYEGQVRARSGLAQRYGIGVLNSPGTIDADYRGEIAVILINHGKKAYRVRDGDRIAQLVFVPVARARFASVRHLSRTRRGDGGFGHTGRR